MVTNPATVQVAVFPLAQGKPKSGVAMNGFSIKKMEKMTSPIDNPSNKRW
jgi:hypothetical protein